MNQEIIELLEDIRHGIDYEFHGKCRCELLVKCNQALALLRTEQLPAGEFTKLARKAIVCLSLAEADEMGNIKDEKGVEGSIEVLFRACDRLDASEASRKELLEALEETSRDFYYIHQHPEDADTDSYKFMEKVEQAKAKTTKDSPEPPINPKHLQPTSDIQIGGTTIPGVKEGSAKDTQADY